GAAPTRAAREIDARGMTVLLFGEPSRGSMRETMGTFRVGVEVANPARCGEWRTLVSVLVDTGAELSWFPTTVLESLGIERGNVRRFRQADGTILDRWTGGVILRVAGVQTWDEVVFTELGDLTLLGARSLEG